jgi:hypothetical protein
MTDLERARAFVNNLLDPKDDAGMEGATALTDLIALLTAVRLEERRACAAIADDMATTYSHSRPCHFVAHNIGEHIRCRS